ncbi:copper resistance protein CopC [Paenibacillus chitinolyticus]|uniref:copper resistance CopC/CopD family protein n=1 Tax=Paenibacillus chitinolyticus TaxID=79263 RepID=UPI002DBC571B|nr:copper resistance protein CopC [Paenibacillus chitinolyticus]MEC0248252.1 copper resistance protein CopC [Paenibacillus chitinolyticus]
MEGKGVKTARRALFTTGLLCLLVILGGLFPREAFAHAILTGTDPAPNSTLAQAPEQIKLTFNEPLEEGVYYIRVLDQSGAKVTDNAATMTKDRTGIVLQLPKLDDGLYVVSYHVISGDGHPVGGSYPLTVGNAAPAAQNGNAGGTSASHNHNLGSTGVDGLIQYTARGLWYAAMLALTGWLLWRRSESGRKLPQEVSAKWTLNLQRFYLVALLFVILTHVEALLGDGGLSQLGSLLTGTGIGISWLAALGLSLAGFVLLGRAAWLDYAWAAALLAVKSLSGHAVTFPPVSASVAADFIHLVAAAVWVGGLTAAAAVYRNRREEFTSFLGRFSGAALGSIIALTVSGVVLTLLFLPSLDRIIYTQWGILLLVKVGVVVLVVGTAAFLRHTMKNRRDKATAKLYKTDFSLMLVILAVVGVLTYLSPAPPNEPLNWHEMGKSVHMTTEVSPKAPGTNTFKVTVWVLDTMGPPKHVQMNAQYEPKEEEEATLAPIQIPLELQENQEENWLEGYNMYTYYTQGPYLPLPGKCTLEVRIMDSNDDEAVYKKEFRLY